MKKKLTLFTILFTIFIACDHPIKQKERKARVIVLCDVSNSTTLQNTKSALKGRLEKLKNYVIEIPKWYSFGSEIFYYVVSDNIVTEQLGPEVSYNIRKRSQLESEKEKVASLTLSINKSLDSLSLKARNSCILLSIKRCINRLNEISRENQKDTFSNELIIISDLIENCRNTDTSTIEMSVVDASKLNKSIEIFDRENAGLDISNLNLTVKVIINSAWMGKKFETIKSSWEKWFYKIGVLPQTHLCSGGRI